MLYLIVFLFQILLLYLLSRKIANKVYGLFFNLTKSRRAANYLFALIFLPGTFLHEIAHFLTALFLLVPVGQIELMPEEKDEALKLGHVPIGKTDPVRRLLIGTAPLIFGVAIIFVSLSLAISKEVLTNPWVILGLSYLAFEVGNTMFSSKKDLEGAWMVLVILIFLLGVLYLLGIRIALSPESILANQFIEVVKKANFFLLVPLVIDSLFLFLFKNQAVIYTE